MNRIPKTEVAFHPLSFGDANGRLFWWKGQLYRAITPEMTARYRRLFDDGLVSQLARDGLLVETEITNLELESAGLVVKHRQVPFVSYAYEWCGEMLREAALVVLNLQIELLYHELMLQDAHPWNVLFDATRPVFVDFGSIVPFNASAHWRAHDEFQRFFLNPLRLIAAGHGRVARWLLHDFDLGVRSEEVTALTGQSAWPHKVRAIAQRAFANAKQKVPRSLRPMAKKTLHAVADGVLPAKDVARAQRELRESLEVLRLPSPKTSWSDYYEDCSPPLLPSKDWNAKHKSVHEVLTWLRPSSVLDMGSNIGWFSQLAASLGIPVVATDVEEACVTQVYQEVRDKKLNVLPLVMDFKNPSPGYGVCNRGLLPASERLGCDMVMGLALTHHLVFHHRLDFDQITDGLAAFTKRYLLVEFIPREDEYVRRWQTDRYEWYTLNRFQESLHRHFENISVYPSHPQPRCLLLCAHA